ncbi:MAG: hypothetical protein M3Y25_10115 [Thermoproteota archaeon]|nr:hypothetical protein [Thermoproteota archaeon]
MECQTWHISGSSTAYNNFTGKQEVIDITAEFVGIPLMARRFHTHQISNLTPISNSQITTDESNNGSSGNSDSSVIPVSNVFDLNGNSHILDL